MKTFSNSCVIVPPNVIVITFYRSTILNFTQFSHHFRLQSTISQSILLSYTAVAG